MGRFASEEQLMAWLMAWLLEPFPWLVLGVYQMKDGYTWWRKTSPC